MHAVSFVGYALAFLAVIIIAARWIYRNHPALRDTDPPPPERRDDGAGARRGGPSHD
ncbi:hypothetical protein D9X30_4026 [Cupriavidus sp. U2]|uniref:hypothetical protein n=1 Tax=Cupriavidus sp. U2 TaxID=2920269 RepID=UPI00129E0BDF|nr:hypothetical protein [Cupriavidus sp. U2]KAI3590541.1 hypothetical protein D9X30_4026 [Cupriavidus sp. U2]